MRTAPVVLVALAACDLGPPPVFDDTGDTEVSCAQSGWEPATSASMQITSLAVDGATLLAGFDPAATYPSGPAACADPNGGGASWIIEVGDEPYAMITIQADRAGSLTLGEEGAISVNVFGDEYPVTFTGPDFVLGAWNVGTLTPTFTTTLSNAQAQQNGRFLTLSVVAEATP